MDSIRTITTLVPLGKRMALETRAESQGEFCCSQRTVRAVLMSIRLTGLLRSLPASSRLFRKVKTGLRPIWLRKGLLQKLAVPVRMGDFIDRRPRMPTKQVKASTRDAVMAQGRLKNELMLLSKSRRKSHRIRNQ